MVPLESATLGYPGEDAVPINGNHLTIATYRSKRDSDYINVVTVLRKFIIEIVEDLRNGT